MHSLLLTDNNTLLMGGLQNYVTEVDLSTVQETQKVRTVVYNVYMFSNIQLDLVVAQTLLLLIVWNVCNHLCNMYCGLNVINVSFSTLADKS